MTRCTQDSDCRLEFTGQNARCYVHDREVFFIMCIGCGSPLVEPFVCVRCGDNGDNPKESE